MFEIPFDFPSDQDTAISLVELLTSYGALAAWDFDAGSGSFVRNWRYAGGVGANILDNPSFDNSTGGLLDDWLTSATPPNTVTVVPAGVEFSSSTIAVFITQDAPIQGNTYRLEIQLESLASGRLEVNILGVNLITESSVITGIATRPDDKIILRTNQFPAEFVIASVAMQQVGEYDLHINGATWHPGVSLGFDGVNDHVDLINRTEVQGLAAATWWLVAEFDTFGAGDVVISKSNEMTLTMSAAGALTATVHYSTSDATTTTADSVISANTRHVIAVSWDDASKTASINVDGVDVTPASPTAGVGSRVSNTNDWSLMALTNGSNATQGALYHAAIFDKTLTDVELAQLARAV